MSRALQRRITRGFLKFVVAVVATIWALSTVVTATVPRPLIPLASTFIFAAAVAAGTWAAWPPPRPKPWRHLRRTSTRQNQIARRTEHP